MCKSMFFESPQIWLFKTSGSIEGHKMPENRQGFGKHAWFDFGTGGGEESWDDGGGGRAPGSGQNPKHSLLEVSKS